jgi:phosphorylase kinase alpha/beta subunit
MQLSPFEIKTRLYQTLSGYDDLNQALRQQEVLHVKQKVQEIDWVIVPEAIDEVLPNGEEKLQVEVGYSWHRKRQIAGTINRVPKDFYPRVWQVLNHAKGLIIGDKLERRNRLDSQLLLSEITPGEKNFALQVEHLLNKIQAPEYRQVNIETALPALR